MANETPLHVVELVAENVKRLRAIRIRPNGELVVIGGRNAQGKSSTLDAIEMALGGGKAIPPDPVRHGARKARVVVDLGELIVERTFTAKGSKLVVQGKNGESVGSPQALLDKLCSAIAFDPLEFSRMKPQAQDELLKRLLGLDFTDLDKDRTALYEARTAANRTAKTLAARLDAIPEPPADLPESEVSVSELVAVLEGAQAQVQANHKDRSSVVALKEQIAHAQADADGWEDSIKALRARVEQEENRLEAVFKERFALCRKLEDEQKRVGALVDPELDVIKARIASAEKVNTQVRKNTERVQVQAECLRAETHAEKLSESISEIDEKKQGLLAAAKFPVPGLGFDADGPTLNDVPLEQASQAEKLRLSVAIGAQLNPRVRIMLVREGSCLDEDGLKLLAKLAKETGSQVFLEKVSTTGEGCSVVIEDGCVQGEPAEPGVD